MNKQSINELILSIGTQQIYIFINYSPTEFIDPCRMELIAMLLMVWRIVQGSDCGMLDLGILIV
jgi:hypothetical protein